MVSEQGSKLPELLRIPGVKDLFIQNGWACSFQENDYLMTPALWNNIYKGAVIENYVVEEFRARGRNLNYFKPSDSMEIDLVYDDGNDIVPVEIKSGRHKRSTSLKNYIDKYKPSYAIRVSERNFGEMDGVRSVPLYALWCMGND